MLIFAIIRWIIGASVVVSLTWFCVLNRDIIPLKWSPLQDSIDIPLYSLILGCTIFGFLLGGLIVWINNSPLRKTKRTQKKKIKTLEQELNAINTTLESTTPMTITK